jgi:hypothetical protein
VYADLDFASGEKVQELSAIEIRLLWLDNVVEHADKSNISSDMYNRDGRRTVPWPDEFDVFDNELQGRKGRHGSGVIPHRHKRSLALEHLEVRLEPGTLESTLSLDDMMCNQRVLPNAVIYGFDALTAGNLKHALDCVFALVKDDVVRAILLGELGLLWR